MWRVHGSSLQSRTDVCSGSETSCPNQAYFDQLGGVELGHHRLEHLVDQRGQNSLVVVLAKGLVDSRQSRDAGSRQHSAGDVDHLQILGTGQRSHISRLGSHVVDDGALEPGNGNVGSLGVNSGRDTADSVVHDGSRTTIHVEKRRVDGGGSNCQNDQASDADKLGASGTSGTLLGLSLQLVELVAEFFPVGVVHCGDVVVQTVGLIFDYHREGLGLVRGDGEVGVIEGLIFGINVWGTLFMSIDISVVFISFYIFSESHFVCPYHPSRRHPELPHSQAECRRERWKQLSWS